MKKSLLFILGGMLMGSCAQDNVFDTPPESKSPVSQDVAFANQGIRGVAHIKVKDEMMAEIKQIAPGGITLHNAPSQMAKVLNGIKATNLTPLFPIDPRFEKRMRREGLDRWYEVQFDDKLDLAQTLTTLKQSELFTIVEPKFATCVPEAKLKLSFAPNMAAQTANSDEMFFNDPLLSVQWHYKNFGRTPKSVAGADMGAFDAWKIETGKPNVIVAVDDGGIDVVHEDLAESMWINPGEVPGNGIDDDGNGYVDDVYGWNFVSESGNVTPDEHGTHVAGTVAARNNNGIGVAGVAGGDGSPESGVRLMSCQIFEGRNGAGGYQTFVYAANNGAVISQNSWGYQYPGPSTIPQSDKEAIDYFIKYAGCDEDGKQLPDSPMKGGVVIFAAGNDGADYLSYPGAYEPTVSVSAMAPDWKASYYTNRGDWVDVMAPGGDEFYPQGMVYSTVPESTGVKYAFMQGTSMACPHVSGIAALVVSKFGGQGFTNEDLKARLLGSLKDENIDEYNPKYVGRLGLGYIDAGRVFDVNQNKKPGNVTDLKAEAQFTHLLLQWSAVADEDDGKPVKYLIYFSDQEITSANYQSLNPMAISALGYKPGDIVSFDIGGLKENTTYYAAVIAVDRWGLKSDLQVATFSTLKNDPPVISGMPTEPVRVTGVEKQTFSVQISDPNGHKLTYKLSGELRGVSAVRNDDRIDFSLRAVAPISDEPYEIVLDVTDELGATVSVSIPFIVYKYQAPSILNTFQDWLTGVGGKQDYDLTQYFSGSDLTFSAKSTNEQVVGATVQGSVLSVTGHQTGEAIVTVTASNPQESLQTNLRVQVVADVAALVYNVYPLPATTKLNILLNPALSKADVSIRTVMGEEVFNKMYSVGKMQPITINVQRLAAGVYTLVVKTSKGTYKQSFVKQ